MARQARQKSSTGIYHVVLKGLDGRNIFLDDADRLMFIDKLKKARQAGGFKLYAYCLMDNHVHLLVKEEEELGQSIKRITVGYVQLHNNKYGRSGHLFQNRFNSEVVEDERYLITVLRYIHRNPLKAGMISKLEFYPWSSYPSIIQSYQTDQTLLDTQMIRDYFPKKSDFVRFSQEENQDQCLEIKTKIRLSDQQLTEILKKNREYHHLESYEKSKRNQLIRQMHGETGSNIRQLSRVLGLGKMIIEQALKERA